MKRLQTIKTLPAALREKKRYVRYGVTSSQRFSRAEIEHALRDAFFRYVGLRGTGLSGFRFLHFAPETQTGVLRVTPKYLDAVRASFVFLDSINKVPALVQSQRVSGALHNVK